MFLVTAALTYGLVVVTGLLTFAQFYPGSGHPPLPGAPDWMYATLLYGACPALGLLAAISTSRLSIRLTRKWWHEPNTSSSSSPLA